MARLILKGLTKSFGDVKAVNDLNMEVKDKEFVALLGPSGCGKTTTLRCIAGLENPDKGSIYIGDKNVTDIHPANRNTSMVFQDYALYPHITAFGNIAFPLRIQKKPIDEIRKEVESVAELLEINKLLNRKPDELSGGERQRVALGRALVRKPKIFLLDEPLANLDAKLRLEMRVKLKKLQRRTETTTIFVTHDQIEALSMADRIGVMNKGMLYQFSTPDKLYRHPVNTFVAGFIGSPPMNLLRCSITEKKGEIFLDLGFHLLPLSDPLKFVTENLKNSEVVLGIRPEDISINKKRKPTSWRTEVYAIESLGDEKLVTLKTDDVLLKVKTKSELFKKESGEIVWVDFNLNKISLFDKEGSSIPFGGRS